MNELQTIINYNNCNKTTREIVLLVSRNLDNITHINSSNVRKNYFNLRVQYIHSYTEVKH